MSKSKTKLKRKEIIIYSIASFLAFAGLFFLILGIVGDHLPLVYSDNWILYSEKIWLTPWSNMGYRYWGLILLGVGALFGVFFLAYFAKEGDKDQERALRRAQRLGKVDEATTVEEVSK
ncbi:MAG TPA: hypothetical protein DEF61_00295 [Firmicutes bacterium]|nr:hypothetical protein [Bacillota bacterium]HBM70365.1 hypothetical protein [Bacillota bacterium]HBX24734.1 hypothetical protein [Bacillota bacterium]